MHYDPSVSLTLGEIRDWLRKMTDEELERYGRDTQYTASRAASDGQPRAVWGLQLKEARAEWRRRAARAAPLVMKR